MREAIVIARHHLKRMVRTPGLILLLLAIPITIAVIEYAAFGGTAARGKLPPVKVLILDEDKTIASSAVPQVFAGGPMREFFEVAAVESLPAASRMFQRGDASAVVRVPKGFQGALLEGSDVAVELYKNPTQTFSPDIVESVLEMVTTIANGLYARAKEPIARIKALTDADREPTTADIAEISVGFFLAGRRLGRLEGLEDLSVEVQRPGGEKSEGAMRGPKPSEFFGTIFPGLVIFALLFISQALAFRLLRDRVRGLQRRLAITPVARGSVVAGGILYILVGLLALLVVLGLIGSLVFRIELREPLALLVLGLGLVAFAAGLQLAIVAVAKDDRGAGAVSSIVVMVLSVLGGTFVPAEQYPPFLKSVAISLPNGAAQQGLVDVLVHKRGLVDLGAFAVTVWLWALAALAAATWIERRRLVR